jgi:signal transduction histidine kinase
MGLRHRSIRLRVGILIVVPVLCLIALYGFAVSITLGNAVTDANANSLKDQLLTPLGTFQTQLYKERHLALLILAEPNSTQLASAIGVQENATRNALSALDSALAAPSVQAAASPQEQSAIATLAAATASARLSSIRTDVADGAISMTTALADYSAIVDDANQVLEGVLAGQSNVTSTAQALDLIGLDQVAQTTLAESDLLAGEIARGKFPLADRTVFAQLAYSRSHQLAATLPQLDPAYKQVITAAVAPSLSSALASLESAAIIIPWRAGAPASLVSGSSVFQSYTTAFTGAIAKIGVDLANRSQNAGNVVFVQLILAAVIGLLGTILSIGLSLYIARGLVRQLRNLRESALALAHDKLPTVIGQLRDGQQVDLSEYQAADEVPTKDEIEQVQQAFNVVQQTAVQSAVDEARLRRGISDVFRNLAGRSQSLLHRQLTLLDGMERRATEPDELEDLFRIDHLTTRMRRHAEGLIILSGEAPARGWRQPVPLVDVLRAAVAEVEDYTRIRVLSRTKAAVAGHAVADVIHLIAELAENATVFSPPNTPVRIQGDVVGRGFAIEIEDRGLGISPERLEEINADLANPPQFDLSGSDRLGLFIAGQLARRHDITVSLRPSVYGGTMAIVLIPTAVVVAEDAYVPDPALPAGTQGSRASGRHASLTGTEHGRLTTGNGHTMSLVADPGPASLPRGSLSPGGMPPDILAPDILVPDILPPGSQPPDIRTPERPAALVGVPSAPADRPQDELDARAATTELPDLGLPVRVRQASLAPQLRDSGHTPAVTPVAEPEQAGTPEPEAARSTMSALQRGWQLGRAQADNELPVRAADPQSARNGDGVTAPAHSEPAGPEPDDAEQHVID